MRQKPKIKNQKPEERVRPSSGFWFLVSGFVPRDFTPLEKAFRVLPTLGYMAIIFMASSIPSPELPVLSALDDSVLHFAAYFGLGLLLMFSAAVFDGSAAARLTGAGVVGVFYGASDEWHQSFVPQRDSSLLDLGFDAAGVLAALLLVYLLLRRSTSR